MCSVRSITLILRPMTGVAHTTSNTLDDAHKEIHLSSQYVAKNAGRARDERGAKPGSPIKESMKKEGWDRRHGYD